MQELATAQHPTAAGGGPATRQKITRVVVELALLVGLYVVYSWVRNQVHGVEDVAVRNAQRVIDFQGHLGLNVEHLLNSRMYYGTVLTVAACWFYAVLHFVVTPTVLVWLFLRRPTFYGRHRAILIAATLVALAIFWLYPMAPPRLTPGSNLADIMAQNADFGWWPESGSAPNTVSNQYAAMPSVHCLWALWCGIAIFQLARRAWVRALGVLYPLATVLVVMATGHHYVMDAIVSAIILTLVTLSVTWIRWRRTKLPAPSLIGSTV